SSGLQIILSRTDPDFVRSILELEIPEIYDKTVEIHKIVREPGYRTKVAVFSRKEDIDPVGACVGLKGVRIQSVIKELEGEKIDILPYDPDPRVFIKNALSPAEVDSVFITDEGKRQALAVVTDSQFSLAIGKQGLNVRLANRLCDWSIDVKTQDQCGELDELLAESRRAAEELFAENDEVLISEFENVDTRVAEILIANNVNEVNAFMNAYEDGSLAKIEGLSQEDIEALYHLINDSVEFTEEQEVVTENSETEEEYEYEEEEYECPECGEKITIDMTTCPSCGIELSFEYEDEE
ncbi:MAG: transcription termination/antitermination protein NusA, partial [Spirochaetaceae bacterium]|nr:transcription termination/antitermination protein NusA [Spirochaetaceae bacterium]